MSYIRSPFGLQTLHRWEKGREVRGSQVSPSVWFLHDVTRHPAAGRQSSHRGRQARRYGNRGASGSVRDNALWEQGDVGVNRKRPVKCSIPSPCHSNPEKPFYACQTATRHLSRLRVMKKRSLMSSPSTKSTNASSISS